MGRRRRLLTALKLGAAGGAVLGAVAGVRRVLAAPMAPPSPPVYPTVPSIYHLVGVTSYNPPTLDLLSEIGTVEASYFDSDTKLSWVRLRSDRDLNTVSRKWFFCAYWRPDVPYVGRISPKTHGTTLPYADPRLNLFRAYQAGLKGETIPQDWFFATLLVDVPGYDESAFGIFKGIVPGFLEQQDVGSAGTFRTITFPQVTTLSGAYITLIAEILGEANARTSWSLYLTGYRDGWGQEFTLQGNWQVQALNIPAGEWTVSGAELRAGESGFAPFSIRNCIIVIPTKGLPDIQQAFGYVPGCQVSNNPAAFYVGPAPSRQVRFPF
jgi:hypothetical protein